MQKNTQERVKPILTWKKAYTLGLILTGLSSGSAMAHIIPTNFGSFDGLTEVAPINRNKGVSGNYGWIDGTDADWADSHKTTWYSFTLTGMADVTLTFQQRSNANGGLGLIPGFTLYEGIPHKSPAGLDHDYSPGAIVIREADCAATPGCTTTEGSFRSLTTFRITNDDDPNGTSPIVFNYIGHAYDGSVDYGTGVIPGGDGIADNLVSKTFTHLAAGSYLAFVGGSNYDSQNTGGNYGVYGTFSLTPSQVPVPGAVWLFGSALAGFFGWSRRKRTV
jgi:hypothetical protein